MSATAKLIYQWRMLRVEEDTFKLPSGISVDRTIIRHPGAALILPVGKNSIRLVRQYRFAVGETLYEIPAGTLEPGEEPLACANRELAEEAKLRSDNWESLGILYPTPGFCDELQHIFVATHCTPCEGTLDEDEILEYQDVSFAELRTLLQSGSIKDAKTLSVILLAQTKGILPLNL